MNERADKRKVTDAARTLALLNEQADGVRAELFELRRDLLVVDREFNKTRTADLLEANERLVLAALHAEAIAEAASSNALKLAHASQRDDLTGTPNRTLMLDRLENAIAAARRRGTRVAVLFLDIDRFKQINDSLGHAVGDEVLKRVARRLESVVRDSDTVSRHGGDEFLVLLSEVTQASDAALIAAKTLTAIAAQSPENDVVVSASLGIAIYPEDGEDAATLVSRADTAMYRCKNRGRGNFGFYNEKTLGSLVPASPIVDVLQQPVTAYEIALADHQTHLLNLREANERLMIAAVNAQALESQAQEANRRQIKFQAMVAHELRNPLTPIRTAAELLSRARTDEPMLARLQTIIKRQVAYMTRLVDDLLDGSRLSAGKFRIEHSVVEIADILELALEIGRPAMEARLQQFALELPPRPLKVHGDPVRLAQIFSNLLDNASKYTPQGGQIALSAVALDETIVITVADNGIGIAPAALPNIFGLFVQDTRALALHNGGLGIGLAVVRELVEAHHGTVIGKSAGKGLGSEFVVTLPMIDTKPAI